MRGAARAGLVLAGAAFTVLLPTWPAHAGAGTPATPARGWVVDRVRFESLDRAGASFSLLGRGEFRGALEIFSARRGVAVVNEVGFEDYLRGVAEVPASWPMEALRAQAIAARTFALHQLLKGPSGPTGADICAAQACQVYLGLGKERAPDGDRWSQAVQSTAGQVVLHKGEPILAMYSSSNGGRSVAGGRPYLRSSPDPDSARGPYNHWRVTIGYDQLASALDVPGITSLRRTGDSVLLDWPGGQTLVAVADFRAKLNDRVPAPDGMPRTVPSTQFSVLVDDGGRVATLDGRGHGHGIGLSQFGALGKATRGVKAADILASYYGGLRPTALDREALPTRIRVALDKGRGAVTVVGSGRFRVLDGAGVPVAMAASGQWRVVPAGRGQVRVVPPPEQEAAPAVEPVAADPPGAALADRGRARFRLSVPAMVHLRVEGPGLREPRQTKAALVEPGEAAVRLPALPAGSYTVSVVADVGAGRSSTATLPLRVRPLAGGLLSQAAELGPAARYRPAAVAWALLLVVGGQLWRMHVRRRPRPGSPG